MADGGYGGGMQAPECSVCLQAYDEDQTVPRVLSCGHTLCQTCLSSLAENPSVCLRCPECNQRSRCVRPSALPKNIEILRLIQPSVKNSRSSWYLGSTDTPRFWIVPHRAVALRASEAAPRPFTNLCGDLSLPGTAQPCPVVLCPIESFGIELDKNKADRAFPEAYERNALSLLESIPPDQTAELLSLLRASLTCSRICPAFGFWMDSASANSLYLVRKEMHHDLEFVIASASSDFQNTPNLSRKPRESVTEVVSGVDSASGIGAESEHIGDCVTIALAIAELVLELHSEGILAALLNPNCIAFDCFQRSYFDFTTALAVRENLRSSHAKQQQQASTNDISWQFTSPEVLLDIRKGETCKEVLTHKSDTWMLGCFLHLCFSKGGEPLWNGWNLHEFCESFVKERGRLDGFLDEQISHCLSLYKGSHASDCRVLIRSCFAFEPADRPDVQQVWNALQRIDGGLRNSKRFSLLNQEEGICSRNFWFCFALGYPTTEALQPAKEIEATASAVAPAMANVDLGTEVVKADAEKNVNPERILLGHDDSVTALAICGPWLLSASLDKTISVWSIKDEVLLGKLKGHSQKIMALATDEQSGLCFSGDYGGEIFVWKVGGISSDSVMHWHEHQDWRYTGVSSLAVSADGFLYSGSGDRSIKVWSLKDYSFSTKMEGHSSVVSTLVVDGAVLFSGSWDGTVRSWWREDHTPLSTLGGNTTGFGPVRSLSVSSDLLFAGYDNGHIQIWRDEINLKVVLAHDGVVSALCVGGDMLFSGSWDCKIKAWKLIDFVDGSENQLLDACNSAVTSLVFCAGTLYAGLADKAIKGREL